jgi:anthranilate synthase/aminodeoxychorismate synthase-like glutamine amidotransferase
MILIIDNYDSFVYNLARYIIELGYHVSVVRNDKITIKTIIASPPSHIIISPGPCGPNQAGISIAIVKHFYGKIPILGVCLGHQVIGYVFGGKVIPAKRPLHGKACAINHNQQGMFSNIPSPLIVGRYHSLIVDDLGLSDKLSITSRSSDGEIMSFSSRPLQLVGMQFHPESVLTEHGHQLLYNFLNNIISEVS